MDVIRGNTEFTALGLLADPQGVGNSYSYVNMGAAAEPMLGAVRSSEIECVQGLSELTTSSARVGNSYSFSPTADSAGLTH